MIQSQQQVEAYRVLPNGRCSNCKAEIRITEDDWIIVKSRLLKIHRENGTVKVKCPSCKQFLVYTSSN